MDRKETLDRMTHKQEATSLDKSSDETISLLTARIAELEASNQALQESEKKYRILAESSYAGIWQIDLEGRTIYANPAMCALLGVADPEALKETTYRSFFTPESLDRMEQEYENKRPKGLSSSYEIELLSVDGKKRDVVISGVPLLDRDGYLSGLIGTFTDISQRKLAEHALQDSEARWRFLVENAPDFILNISLDGKILYLNRSAPGMDMNQILGTSIFSFIEESFHELVRTALAKVAKTGEVDGYDNQGYGLDGSLRWYRNRVGPIFKDAQVAGFLIVATDITALKEAELERLAMEQRIQRSQKLESLGSLAGGIAHDFNNLLMGILGNSSLAVMELSQRSPAREYIEKIETVAMHGVELTNQMLAYAGKSKFAFQALNLSGIVQDMTHLLDMAVGRKGILHYRLAEELPLLEGDSAQLQQVVLNLVTNAAESLIEQSGWIEISTGIIQVKHELFTSVVVDGGLTEGPHLYFQVKDNGCGMVPSVQRRIFEPFFSTKFLGRGLGLPAVLGIVKAHSASILLASEPEKGTTFMILFAIQPDTVKNKIPDEKKETSFKHSPTILVVDDEEVIRLVIKASLEKFNFKVVLARDGVEAVQIFSEQFDEIDAVLLDMTMPNMDGAEAFMQLRRLKPEVKIMFSSGFTEQEAMEQLKEHRQIAFIQKPYQPSDLLQKLLEIMD